MQSTMTHPMIKPSLRRGWRDQQTVRYGVTPAHSVLFGPLDSATESFLSLLDGTRGLPALRDAAATLGLGPAAADRLAGQLAEAGVLDDATADREASAQVTEGLRPDLASLSLLDCEPGGGLRRLTARRRAWVQVRGAGRVGAALAATLAQAGVGDVEVVDGGRVEPADTAPGGVRPEQAGERRNVAARRVVGAAVPWRRGSGRERPEAGGPRLVVFAPRDGITAYAPDPAPAEPVLRAGTPHLYAGVVEATGFIGPLVLPGRTGCAGCMLRARAVLEPGWPLLVGHWRNAKQRGVPACDAALATAVSGLAACTVLGYLDGLSSPATSSRTEVALPGLSMETHAVEPHPECPCGAARSRREEAAIKG
jgi:bacteriocin biosynthesis cyclodehydratase domain-containing protein